MRSRTARALVYARKQPFTIERTHKNVDIYDTSDVMNDPVWKQSDQRPFSFK